MKNSKKKESLFNSPPNKNINNFIYKNVPTSRTTNIIRCLYNIEYIYSFPFNIVGYKLFYNFYLSKIVHCIPLILAIPLSDFFPTHLFKFHYPLNYPLPIFQIYFKKKTKTSFFYSQFQKKRESLFNSLTHKNINNSKINNLFLSHRINFESNLKRFFEKMKLCFSLHRIQFKLLLYKRLICYYKKLFLSFYHRLENQKIESKSLKPSIPNINLFSSIFSNIQNILNPFLFIDSISYSLYSDSEYTEKDILNAKKSVVRKNVLKNINIIKSSVDNNYISSTNDVKDICNVGRNTINSYFKKIYLSNIDDPKYLLYCKTKNGRGHPFYLVKNLSLEFLTFLLFLSSYFNKPIFLLIDYIYSFNDIGHSNKCINS